MCFLFWGVVIIVVKMNCNKLAWFELLFLLVVVSYIASVVNLIHWEEGNSLRNCLHLIGISVKHFRDCYLM